MKIRCGAILAAAVAAFLAAGGSYAADGVPLPGLPGAEVSFRIIAEEFGSSNRAMKVAAPSNMKAVDVKAGKDGKTVVTWRGSETFGADFTVTAVFEALPDGSVGWTFGYANCECPLPVAEVRFPIVTVPRGPETAILYPASIGALVWPEWAKCRPGATVASARPQTFHFIAALTEGGTGWYLDQRDEARFYTGRFSAKAGQKAGTVSLEAVCEPPAASPRDWRMPFGGTIAALPGADWFAAAARYREWARRQPWYGAARARGFGKMRDIAMWFWNRGAVDNVIPPVERFQKASGVPAALDWYWWHDIPYDTGFPNFWPPREGEAAFRAAVKRCNDAGIFIQVYTNGMTWDLDDPSWPEGGEEGVRIRKDGTFRATAFNRFLPHRLAYMCGTAEKYQERMRKLYRTLASTGMPGIYMDMIGNASYDPCYSTNHVHAPGGGTHGIKGYRKFAAQVKADNPGILLCTEDATEPYLDVFDAGICLACNYERFGNNDDRRYAVPVNQAVYHGCEVLFGSFAMVHGIPAFDPKWPTDRKWKVEKDWKAMFPDQFALELVRGVTWGMQPMVHNFRPGDDTDPRFADDYQLMIDTARFYHGNRDFLFDGDMCAPGKMECDTQKIDFLVRGTYAREGEYRTITRNTIPAVLHSVWRAPDGRTAAVLVNWTRTPRKYALSAPDVSAKGEIPPRSWRLVPAAQCPAATTTVRPKATGDALVNPDMGFMYYHYSNRLWAYGMNTKSGDTLDWFPGCSTIYYRLLWNDLEPTEGHYRWDILDSTAQNWIAKGKKLCFRVICCNQTETATPQFVRDAGAKGYMFEYKTDTAPGGKLPPRWEPVYDDPVFLAKLENFIKAFAKRYDGDPNVAFVDVGSFGIYGEGHVHNTSQQWLSKPEHRAEFVRLAKLHLDLWKRLMPNTYLVVSDDIDGGWNPEEDPEMMRYCREVGIGFRDDSIFCFPPKGTVKNCPFEYWAHDGWARKFAPKWPVVVETGHCPHLVGSPKWDNDAYVRCVEAYQASYMSIHDFPDVHLRECRDSINRINRILGYRFELREATFPAQVAAGEEVEISSRWVNVGVAPRTKPTALTWSLLNADGTVAWSVTDGSFDFRSLEPRLKGVEKPVAVKTKCAFGYNKVIPQPDNCVVWAREKGRVFDDVVTMLKPGKYTLAVSVGSLQGTPQIALPLEGQVGSTRRYALGEIEVKETPARDVRVFVDGAECRGLKALGKAVARPAGEATLFTAGGSFANRWLTDASVGPGNFLVKTRLSIDNPIFCDASIRVGGGEREVIVTLQGINGLFSISGPLVRTDLETGRVMKSEMQVRGKKPFELAIERVGDQLSVSCDGRLIRRHTVTDGGLGPVGIVPMRGALRIERLEVTANFAPFEQVKSMDVNDMCRVKALPPLVELPKSFPIGPFTKLKDGSVMAIDRCHALISPDGGKTWKRHAMFRDPKFRLYQEHSAVCLEDGTVVVMFINIGEQKCSWDVQRNRPNPENRLPTYCVRSLDNGRTWEEPILIDNTYSGCMRGMILTKSGTLVAMVQRLNYEEGRNYSQPYWSNDKGKTWHPADVMDCGKEHGDHSGLIEATLVQLKDGRLWTLLRSYHGFFYEAFSSDDGHTWAPIPPRRSKIASTGSPGMLKRLSDGSLVLLYNAIPTKGYERREELFVSFSEDEGESWTKPFVVARNAGARVAYAYIDEPVPGELWISSMQGGLRARTTLAELKAAAKGCP